MHNIKKRALFLYNITDRYRMKMENDHPLFFLNAHLQWISSHSFIFGRLDIPLTQLRCVFLNKKPNCPHIIHNRNKSDQERCGSTNIVWSTYNSCIALPFPVEEKNECGKEDQSLDEPTCIEEYVENMEQCRILTNSSSANQTECVEFYWYAYCRMPLKLRFI